MAVIPTMWLASSRTSQAGQSVGRRQWSSSRSASAATIRSYSVAARRMARSWGRADCRGSGRVRLSVVVIIGGPSGSGTWSRGKADGIGPHGKRAVEQSGVPSPAGVVGVVLVDQAGDQRDPEVEVVVGLDAEVTELVPRAL